MPTISFRKNFSPVNVEMGANLMQALLKAGLPVASSCYGDGVCGKCRLEVVNGEMNLSGAQDLEKTLCERLRIRSPMRISCQTTVMGDITVDATYW